MEAHAHVCTDRLVAILFAAFLLAVRTNLSRLGAGAPLNNPEVLKSSSTSLQ